MNKDDKDLKSPAPAAAPEQDHLKIKCPKCEHALDSHLLENLRFLVVFELDPKTKAPKQKIQLEGTVSCPKCSEVLNDFLMKSLSPTLAQSEKPQPAAPLEFIEWESGFDLGIEIIDKQHQKLVGLINRLHRAVTTGKREANFVRNIVSELFNYTVEHFQTEEKLQIGTRYPGLAIHKKQHQEFINAVASLDNDFHTGIVDLRPILNFVKGWFLEHSQGSDKLFVKFLQERKPS